MTGPTRPASDAPVACPPSCAAFRGSTGPNLTPADRRDDGLGPYRAIDRTASGSDVPLTVRAA